MGVLQMLLFDRGHYEEISSLPIVLSRFRTGAIALIRRAEAITSLLTTLMSTRPSVMGPIMSSLPSERHAAELMLLSVVNAWPPHHAVRGSGEPI
ncbi:hypothetical protein XI08_19460 [Bradyrhizobium sp. CCBAU 11361]|nr:hypothetical protein [Bradyrhizobium sp. CCBAU 11361]